MVLGRGHSRCHVENCTVRAVVSSVAQALLAGSALRADASARGTAGQDEEPGLAATYARFDTTEGTFTVRLLDQEAPKTVENFVGLAEGTKQWSDPRTNEKVTKPYYDGTIFHRVIDGFMIQGGDPLGQGIGGPGYNFADEFHPKARHNKQGI